MSFFLNPRVLVTLALVAALGLSHFMAFRKGKQDVRNEWLAATASANTEARRLEQARQRRADESAAGAAAREARLRADAAGAGDALRRLRDAISRPVDATEQSCAAATERAATRGQLLVESAEAHRELAATCDRHVNDLKQYIEAWPQ